MTGKVPVVYGKYQLLEQLARGGMAEVFKAKAHGVKGFEKTLVIKRILPELSENPSFVEMFVNEAKIAVTLSHANIVQVFDLGRAEDTYFIAMEYVAGMDLASVFKLCDRAKQPMPIGLAVYVVSELAKGLDYAHRRRDAEMRPLHIVHRDVSPPNVLLSYEGEVKLTDFGIAKARTLAQTVTEVGIVKGKYAYMAPEQLEGGMVDARADIFAAGTLLFKALSGVNPFLDRSVYDTLQRIRAEDVPSVREFAPELPEEVDALLRRAMARDPEDRFESAGTFQEELIHFLYGSGQRVGARDLSDYLLQLRSSDGEEMPEVDLEQLQAAFEDGEEEEALSEEEAERSEVTRVERWRGPRRTVSVSPSTISLQDKAEWRDVTVLAVRFSAEEELRAASIPEVVERYSGTLLEDEPGEGAEGEKILLALFGFSNPDGREAQNAARCALQLSRVAVASAADNGRTSSMSIGLSSGRILVNLEGDRKKDDAYRALLERANSLAREGDGGDTLVCGQTEKALRGRFSLSPPAAGERENEAVYLLSSERSGAAMHGRFIGRRQELKRIGEVLALANRGELQVIGLRGEAGSGKSRMLSEIMRRLTLAGRNAGLYLATLGAFMREAPLSAIQQMLRVVLGLDEFVPEPLLRNRTVRLRELGLLDKEREAIAAALGLRATDKPRSSSRPLRAALQRTVEKLAQDQLAIFAWDGAEYTDEYSLSIVDQMLRSFRRARVVIFLCYQPQFVPRWSQAAWFTEIDLDSLSDHEVASLIASRLRFEEIPIELLREVSIKCGGNPLYIEEYLSSLIESGALTFDEGQVTFRPEAARAELPKTLRGMVASRVARLTPSARYLLQVASLAGERFNANEVAGASGEDMSVVSGALEELVAQGIVKHQGESVYAFANDLVPQVVREGVTLQARREMHLAIAVALEQLYPERLDEMAERLAHHYREAGAREKAVDYLVRAADRFEADYALAGAIASLVKAIEILQLMLSPERERMLALYERVAELSFLSADLLAGAERMERALKVAEGMGNEVYTARFSMWRGRLLVAASDVEEGRRWLDQARHVARAVPDNALSRDVLLATADAEARSGEYEKAVGMMREALQLARESGEAEAEIGCLMPLAVTYSRMGDKQLALQALSEARVLAGELSDPYTDCRLFRLESRIHYFARDFAAAIKAAEKALELARENGFALESVLNAYNIGRAHLQMEDYKRAFASLRLSHDISQEHGFSRTQMANLRLLGYIDAFRFGSEEGRNRLLQGIAFAESRGYAWDTIRGHYLVALVDQQRGDLQKAFARLRSALKLAAEHGHRQTASDIERALRRLDAGERIELPL